MESIRIKKEDLSDFTMMVDDAGNILKESITDKENQGFILVSIDMKTREFAFLQFMSAVKFENIIESMYQDEEARVLLRDGIATLAKVLDDDKREELTNI